MILDINAQTHGLPHCLITPIGAKSIKAIVQYVGEITEAMKDNRALIVTVEPLEPPNGFGVWSHPRAHLINATKQIWVDVNYANYSRYYRDKWSETDLPGYVVDHIMNRRFARILGYKYVRLLHISRGVNSSSGRGPENESVEYQVSDVNSEYKKLSKAIISYADPSDLLKMLNIKTGGFPLDAVRDNMHLFYS